MKIKFQNLFNTPKENFFTFPSPLGGNALNLPAFHIWVLGFKLEGVNFFTWMAFLKTF